MEQKLDRRILKTRAAIMDAYYHILCENQNAKITVAEISRLANIDRKTFYLHYDGVDKVLEAFIMERIRELTGWMEQNNFYESPLSQLEGIFLKLNEILSRDATFYRHLASNEKFSFFWKQIQDLLVNALVNSYAEQVNVTKEQLRIYCEFFISGIIHIYQNYLTDPDNMNMEEISTVVQDILYHGAQNLFETK